MGLQSCLLRILEILQNKPEEIKTNTPVVTPRKTLVGSQNNLGSQDILSGTKNNNSGSQNNLSSSQNLQTTLSGSQKLPAEDSSQKFIPLSEVQEERELTRRRIEESKFYLTEYGTVPMLLKFLLARSEIESAVSLVFSNRLPPSVFVSEVVCGVPASEIANVFAVLIKLGSSRSNIRSFTKTITNNYQKQS